MIVAIAIGAVFALLMTADAGLGYNVVHDDQPIPSGVGVAPAAPDLPPSVRSVDALHLPPRKGITTVVSLTFDDGLLDQYALRTLLPEHHLTATLYASSGLLANAGYPGRMSLSALYDLSRSGVEIGGHTAHHPDLAELWPVSARAEICGDRDQLQAWGFEVVSFAYPSSISTPRVQRLPRRCGYLSARSVGGVVCRGCTTAETYPPLNRYSLRTPDGIEWRTRLSELKHEVMMAEDSAALTGIPQWLILNFHHICDRCNKFAVTERHLAALLTWLSDRPPSTAVRAVGAVMLHGFT